MFDAELYKRIIDCELTFEELEALLQQTKMLYDFDNSFDKYFNLEKVEHAIGLYRSHKISDRYLSDWAYLYDQIIMATSRNTKREVFDLKRNIMENISRWLEALSFFDENDGTKELTEEEKNTSNKAELDYDYENLLFYSTIYKNLPDWTACYAKSCYDVEEGNEDFILCINRCDKTYFTMCGVMDKRGVPKECYLNNKQWIQKKVELKKSGYQQIGLNID